MIFIFKISASLLRLSVIYTIMYALCFLFLLLFGGNYERHPLQDLSGRIGNAAAVVQRACGYEEETRADLKSGHLTAGHPAGTVRYLL